MKGSANKRIIKKNPSERSTKKSPSPKDSEEEREKEITKRIRFKYMRWRDIPKSVDHFKKKRRTWFEFDKALEAIGLNGKAVLARLKENLPAAECERAQGI